MVKIEDKMAEFVGKFMTVVLKDGTEFELKPTEGNKRKWLSNYKRSQLDSTLLSKKVQDNTATKEDYDISNKLSDEIYDEDMKELKLVLQKSYPQFTEDKIDTILQKYDSELLDEIFIWYKWIDPEIREAQRKAIMVALGKLNGEVQTPSQTKHQNKDITDLETKQ